MAMAMCIGAAWAADEGPSLPTGLGDSGGPALPGGLEEESGPPLPIGMEGEATPTKSEAAGSGKRKLSEVLGLSGFWDIRAGIRTQRDRHEQQASLAETRLQLESQKRIGPVTSKVVTDFLYDGLADSRKIDLETGQGWMDLREANISWSPFSFADVKVGRQILTWGTGDLVFINDLFPKDYVSFFAGRDEAYLKAPSDAIKTSIFTDAVNVDIIYTPVFDSDRYITGRRMSYYNAMLGEAAGRNAIMQADVPNEWFNDSEWAARVYRNVSGYELAAYGYWGYWKSPGGMDAATGKATFPRLSVYGASARGQFARGIGNVEAGYYDSREDRAGGDPNVSNSEFRFLLGYEQDLKQISRDLTIGMQYYLEWMQDYDAYRSALPAGMPEADEYRHVVTLRLTKLLMNQNLRLSVFTFYSPSDGDVYMRPNLSYKMNDHWTFVAGGNVFFGESEETFFGQFADNTNVYCGLRYGF